MASQEITLPNALESSSDSLSWQNCREESLPLVVRSNACSCTLVTLPAPLLTSYLTEPRMSRLALPVTCSLLAASRIRRWGGTRANVDSKLAKRQNLEVENEKGKKWIKKKTKKWCNVLNTSDYVAGVCNERCHTEGTGRRLQDDGPPEIASHLATCLWRDYKNDRW